MTSLLLRLYCVELLVVHLESRWKKVESVALAARLVSGWRHWSDNVLISRPPPNGNHGREQEVCSAGDSHRLGGRHGARWDLVVSSHTSGLHQSQLICKRAEGTKLRGCWCFRMTLIFLWINVVGQFEHVIEKYRAPYPRCVDSVSFFSHIKSSSFSMNIPTPFPLSISVSWSITWIPNPTGNHTSTSGASASSTDSIISK